MPATIMSSPFCNILCVSTYALHGHSISGSVKATRSQAQVNPKPASLLVNNNPLMRTTVYGEQAQLPGIDQVWLDVDSPGLLTLLPQREQMPYEFEGPNKGRMSKRQYDAIMEPQGASSQSS